MNMPSKSALMDGRRFLRAVGLMDPVNMDAEAQERLIMNIKCFLESNRAVLEGEVEGGPIIEKLMCILDGIEETPPKLVSTGCVGGEPTAIETITSISTSTTPTEVAPFHSLVKDRLSHHSEKTSPDRTQGLLNMQKAITREETETERRMHDLLTSELSEMTETLKGSTMRIHEMIVTQNELLDEIQQDAGENIEELNEQRKVVTKREQEATTSLWATIINIVFAFAVFIVALVIIRIFPEPRE